MSAGLPALPTQPAAAASQCAARIRASTNPRPSSAHVGLRWDGRPIVQGLGSRAGVTGDVSAAVCKACRGHTVVNAMHTFVKCAGKSIVSHGVRANVLGTKGHKGVAGRSTLSVMWTRVKNKTNNCNGLKNPSWLFNQLVAGTVNQIAEQTKETDTLQTKQGRIKWRRDKRKHLEKQHAATIDDLEEKL